MKKLTIEQFIKKAQQIHGDEYNYQSVDYENSHSKIKIECSIHGEFEQKVYAHLQGQGCPKCRYVKSSEKLTIAFDKIRDRFNEIHNCKYDYSKVDYKNTKIKVEIICPHHGSFWQVPYEHLKGSGCPKCYSEERSLKNRYTLDQTLSLFRKVHKDKYDYGNMDYINSKTKVKIICPEHGIFEQRPNNHILGEGCPKCVNKVSKAEQELYDFIKIFKEDAEQSNRKIIKPYELDVYIPSLSLAFEYNGEYWHSEKFRDKDHRQHKTELCVLKNIKLIHIEEKDWKKDKEQVKNNIKTLIIK